MSHRARWSFAAALAVASLGVPVLPAQAMPPAGAVLRLTVQDSSHVSHDVELICNPGAGSHPNPTSACDALAGVDGQLERLPGRESLCTMEFNPVTARAHGHWYDRPVYFVGRYSNPCLLRNALAPVYDF